MSVLGEVTAPKVDQSGPGDDSEFIYVDISSIDNRTKRIVEPKRLPAASAPSRARQRLKSGDVLVSMTRPNLNAVAIVPPDLDGAIGSTGFHVLRANEDVEPRWLYYAVQNPRFVQSLAEVVQGALYPAVRPKDIREYPVDPPPLNTQRKIVAEIEKQFSRLDEAVANLQRVKANLKRYKASVLKAAVEGRLVPTEAELAHSEGHRPESGNEMLKRILEMRRESWAGKGKYVEPDMSTRPRLPELPAGWAWVPFGILGKDPSNTVQTGPFGAQLHNTEFRPEGVPVIAVGNLTGTGFRREGLYFVDRDKAAKLERYDVWAGDLLFARSGATLGKVCVAPSYVQGWRMTGHILRARLNTQFINPEVAVYSLAALPAVRKQVFGMVRGVTRPGFNTSLLESIWIPVPPLPEQRRIVAEADRRLSILREVESEVDANLNRAYALRQAALANAFSGQLKTRLL